MKHNKILIVEDEKLVARDLAFALEEAGYQVLGMISYGHEVIDRVAKLKPDLVLLDINILGSINGIQVAEYLHRYWQIPVVFLTANTDHETFTQAKKTYAYGFLMKPYSARQLITTVETAIETHRNNQEKLTNLRSNITNALPHELNTALNNILGLSEITITEYNSLTDEEVLEFLADIYSSAKRLQFFTKRYLDFAQLEVLISNPDRLEIMAKMEPVIHCKDVIEALISRLNQNNDREFILNLVDSNLDFPLEFFNSLLLELIDNCLRYSIPKTPIEIYTNQEGDYFVINIRNQALSFDLDTISDEGAYVKSQKIFQDQQGSGLGLGIVYRILYLLDGLITFNFNNSVLDVQIKIPIKYCALQLG
jgi:DNA-binding NarL/FixJ family response regulator